MRKQIFHYTSFVRKTFVKTWDGDFAMTFQLFQATLKGGPSSSCTGRWRSSSSWKMRLGRAEVHVNDHKALLLTNQLYMDI